MGRTFQVVQTLQFQGLPLALILVAQVLVTITVGCEPNLTSFSVPETAVCSMARLSSLIKQKTVICANYSCNNKLEMQNRSRQ